jgi:hypothetical protein
VVAESLLLLKQSLEGFLSVQPDYRSQTSHLLLNPCTLLNKGGLTVGGGGAGKATEGKRLALFQF